jgi:hypothetical protein
MVVNGRYENLLPNRKRERDKVKWHGIDKETAKTLRLKISVA